MREMVEFVRNGTDDAVVRFVVVAIIQFSDDGKIGKMDVAALAV